MELLSSENEITSPIERFAFSCGSTVSEHPYWVLNPEGTYTYVFSKDRQSISTVANRISGETLERRLGSTALYIGSRFPMFFHTVPNMSLSMVAVASNYSFDVAIISHRLKLLSFSEQQAITVSLGGDEAVRQEYEARQSIPDSLPVPKLLEANMEYPYFIEEYIQGMPLQNPVDDWVELLAALTKLQPLYTDEDTDKIPIDIVIETLLGDIVSSTPLESDVVNDYLEAAKKAGLPSHITESNIHGDIHAQNIMKTQSGELYVLDWEDTRRDYVIMDWYRAFAVYCYNSESMRVFKEMVSGDGIGSDIHNELASVLGKCTYGDIDTYRGLPILYLVCELNRIDSDDDLWNTINRICSEISSDVNPSTTHK